MERQSVELLRPVFGEIEILPIICNFGDYVIVNVLTTLDCVDYENSKFKRFPQVDPNIIPRIMMFTEYAFRPEAIADHHIFRIIDLPRSLLFVDDVFVSEVKKHNITGFNFKQVWSSEDK